MAIQIVPPQLFPVTSTGDAKSLNSSDEPNFITQYDLNNDNFYALK